MFLIQLSLSIFSKLLDRPLIITSTIYNWHRKTAMPLQGRLTVN